MFIFLLLVFTKRFHLKIYKKCKFLGGKDKKTIRAGDAKTADLLSSNINKKNVPVIVTTKNNKAFDIEGFKIKLVYYRKTGGRNQKFTFKFLDDDKKLVKLKVMGGCITYVEDQNLFKKRKCNDTNENQIFELRNYGDFKCEDSSDNDENNLLIGQVKPIKRISPVIKSGMSPIIQPVNTPVIQPGVVPIIQPVIKTTIHPRDLSED
ncbi:hypothetical protein DMUE_4185 [Dictyocoela muelleri]|nr:hypothetical protein DMUE_4185 [Dictyocoela muelleri]